MNCNCTQPNQGVTRRIQYQIYQMSIEEAEERRCKGEDKMEDHVDAVLESGKPPAG